MEANAGQNLTQERWQQIKSIFQFAVELEPSEQDALLERACSGDPALRKRVESLMSSDEQGWDLLETPAFEAVAGLFAEDRPALSIGQYLGHYEVLDLLGAGGMGEVYLAHDEMLDRKVALKLLPSEYVSNDERLRRFQQEARAASALNHPNIITIYEIGESDGCCFIASEFINGETLRQCLRRQAMSIAKALDISIQVANALSVAHEASITHRDVKPENIMLRPDGYVKVLDFGLAEPADQHLGGAGEGDDEIAGSTPGLVIGTVKYMSPEQARGLAVDTRSDIFSLGVVIYEMITGRAPFEGETASDLIASLLKEEPLLIRKHSPDSPDELQRIISKALHKDKQKRYQTINDMLIDLMTLKQDPGIGGKLQAFARSASSGSTNASAESNGEIIGTSSALSSKTNTSRLEPHKRTVFLAGLFLLVVAVSIAYGPNLLRRQAEPFRAMKVTRLTNNGKTYHAAISPEGKKIVYKLYENGQSSLWLKDLQTGRDVQVLAHAEAEYGDLTFSPDGNYVYFIQVDKTDPEGALYRMPVLGGATGKLVTGIYNGVTFSPEGTRMAFTRNDEARGESALMLADLDGTREQRLAVRRLPDMFVYPAWSPDGSVIACVVAETNGDNRGNHHNVAEVRVADGAERLISSRWWRGMTQVAWLADGSGLLIAAKERTARPRQIWHLSYPSGEASIVTNDTNDYNELSLTSDCTAAVALQSENLFGIWIAPNGNASQSKQITSGANKGDGQHGLSWTPDDRIVYETDIGQNYDIWIMDSDGNNRKQLTIDPQMDVQPVVTPDGRHVVFISDRAVTQNLWRMDIDGSNPKQLTHGQYDIDQQCSPDGQWLVYAAIDAGKATLQKISIEGGEAVQLSDKLTRGPAVSPDGKLIAGFYMDTPTNRWRVAVIPFVGGAPVKIFDSPAAIDTEVPLRWTPDGRALAYSARSVTVSNIWSQPIDGGPPKRLTDFRADHISSFDWSRDGRHLALVRGRWSNDVVLISDFR